MKKRQNDKHLLKAPDKKRVVILGSGFVSRPIIEHLAQNTRISLTVASLFKKDVESVTQGLENISRKEVNINHRPSLKKLLKDSDIVVSLLPAHMHPVVARTALDTKNHFINTSYLSDRIKEIHDEAIKKGLIFINECGMDPGLDHMSTMSLVDALKKKRYQITGYESYGSGIPSPEANTNPWGYKFSWSPRGVISASQNGAVFLRKGQVYNKLPGTIFNDPWPVKIKGLTELEAYPNRNSLNYIQLYGLNGVQTMIRATLRNKGWSTIWKSLYNSGILNEYVLIKAPKTYREYFDIISDNHYKGLDKASLKKKMKDCFPPEVIGKIEWLGLFDERKLITDKKNTVEILTDLLSKKLAYEVNERDMVILHHRVSAKKENQRVKKFKSTFIAYGTPGGASAMSKSVSLPSAIAVEAIINGKISIPGVHIPVIPEIYKPILKGLKKVGLEIEETKID